MSAVQEVPSEPPVLANPRFELELEFVSSLANPAYLQYLAVTYPNLFNPLETAAKTNSSKKTAKNDDNSDAACFARYVKYLLDYWRTPEYARYLTHPAATIRNLELLQNERFRRDIARPDVIARLTEGFKGVAEYEPLEQSQTQTGDLDASGEGLAQVDANGNSQLTKS